jgi:dihydroxyacetone kinase phosphoprotein-dependent L subunit
MSFELTHLEQLFPVLREIFESNQAELNRLDSAIGDGDHGHTMVRVFRAVDREVRGPFEDLGEGFEAAARVIAERAGGAIGPLLAPLFAEGGRVWKGQARADTASFAAFLRGGLEAVQAVGLAEVGEKTLVDALHPAVRAVLDQESAPLLPALQAAREAADDGARRTAGMRAGRGRARFVGARSTGHQDPGARSLALILEGFVEVLEGRTADPLPPEAQSQPEPPPGKLINHPDEIVRDDNRGLALAYPELVRLTERSILVRARPKQQGKVGLAIGHGGGHTPSMGGFVGPGLLDADAYGPIFTCASGVRIAEAVRLADRGAGVVLLVSNHSGDVLNARLAHHLAEQDGLEVKPVVLGDDIATAPRERLEDRRGLGGLLFALKTGGACAERGESLGRVAAVLEKTNRRTATLAVSVSAPSHPATGEALFHLPPGQIEIGTGVHGEVGVYQGPHLPAAEIIEKLLDRLVPDLAGFASRRMLVFLNGSGGTSLTELHILYQDAHRGLTDRGLSVEAGVVDSYFTTGEMGGFSLSLCAVDEELLELWHAPASGPSFRWPRV